MARRLAPLCLLLASGCDHELSFGNFRELSDSGVDAATPDAAPDAGSKDAGADGGFAFSCTQRGPLFPSTDVVRSACADSRGFHYALCTCGNAYTVDGGIVIDGFDSRRGRYAPGQASGSLAIHGQFDPEFDDVRVGGSLFVGSNLNAAAEVVVGRDLIVGGDLFEPPARVQVGGDALLGGNVQVGGLAVGGTLTVAEGASVAVDAGAIVRAPVSITPPCRCDEGFDRGALIARARTDNDNVARGFDPALLQPTRAPVDLSLPCGRYFVDELAAKHPVVLRITGRAILYVASRIYVEPSASLQIELAPDAELDLFLGTGITALGPFTLGSEATSARVRVYAGTAASGLLFEQRALIGGAVHAPAASLVAKDTFELYGAALLRVAGPERTMQIHYDRALHGDSCDQARCANGASCAPGLHCDADQCLP